MFIKTLIFIYICILIIKYIPIKFLHLHLLFFYLIYKFFYLYIEKKPIKYDESYEKENIVQLDLDLD